MCGRYSLAVDTAVLREFFRYTVERFDFSPNYNIAPGTQVPIIHYDGESQVRQVRSMRWGLIPGWAKDRSVGYRMINARAETVHEKPAYKVPFNKRRCLVPADGFYEWRKQEGKKTPYRVSLPGGGLFAFAGLWDCWMPPEGEESVYSFSIITTDANRSIADIHPRMPVILNGDDQDAWIDPAASAEQLKALLKPYAGELATYEVSPLVNLPANNFPELILPKPEGRERR